MAKWKRSGLDAMNEYFANGGKKPSGMQTGQNSKQTSDWKRSGLDAMNEYFANGGGKTIQSTPKSGDVRSYNPSGTPALQKPKTAQANSQTRNVDASVRRALDQQSRAYAGRTDAMRNVENAYISAGAGAAARDAAHQNTAYAQKQQELWQKKARGVTLTPAEQQILNRNVYKSPEKAQQREANQQINDNLQWAQERKQKRETQLSEQEFNRSPAMQAQYGSYNNYLRGVTAGYDEAVAKREQEQAKTSKEWQADSDALQAEMDKITGQLAVAYRNPSAENYQSIISMQRQWNDLNRQKKETDKRVEEKQIAEKRAARQEAQRAAQEQYAGWTEEQMQGRLDELNREINSRLAKSGETADVFALKQERAALQGEKSRVYPNTLQKIGNYAEDAVDALMLAGTAQAMTGYEQAHAYAEAGANTAAAWALRDIANSEILRELGGEKYAEKLRSLADKMAVDVDYTGAQQWQEEYQRIMNEATKDHSGAGKWILEQLPSAGAMIVDQGMAGLFGVNAGTGAMNVTPLTMMGIRAGGSAALDAKNEGATDAQAVLIGLENAAVEVFSEKLFGGNPMYDTDVGLVNRAAAKLTNSKNIMRVLDSKAFDFVSEGLEEVVAELLEPTFQSMVLHGTLEGATNAENIGNAFLGGVFLAALGKAAGLPSGATQAQEERHIQNYAQTLSQAGMQSENAEVRAAAEAMQEKLDYGRTPDEADFGRLINAMDAANETEGAAAAVNEAQTESTTVNTDPAEHTSAEQAVIDAYQDSTDESLREVFEAQYSGEQKGFIRHTISDVSERQAADAARILGGEYNGYKNAINSNGVRHIINEHGPDGTADHSLRDFNDAARIGYVLDNYDSVVQTTYKKSGDADYSAEFRTKDNVPAPMLKFSKKVNGTFYVVEAIPESKHKKFWVVGAYMEADNGTQAPNANGPRNTSDTSLASSLSADSSVAEPADAVKRTDANPATQEQTEFRAGLEYDDYVKNAVRDGELTAENAQRIDTVAKRLGVRVRFADEVAGGMANAEISGNEVLVEKHNRNPVMFLLGHEWTHRLQEIAPEQYQQFKESIMDEIRPQAQAVMENYARQGYEITEEAALDEAAADYAGRMIDDSDVLDEFIEKHRDDRTLLQRIVDALRSLIQKLTGAERKKAETAEGKLLAALDAAAENAKTTSGESGTRYSFAGLKDSEVRAQAEAMESDGKTPEEIWRALGVARTMDGKGWRYEIDDSTVKLKNEMLYDYQAELRDQNRAWEKLTDRALSDEQVHDLADYMKGAIEDRHDEKLYDKLENEFGGDFIKWADALENVKEAKKVPRNGASLEEFIDAAELFAAYPQLRDTRLVFQNLDSGENGYYDRQRDIIVLSERLRRKSESTLLHEIQHVIQGIDKTPGGASPGYWKRRMEEGYSRRENDGRIAKAEKEYRRIFDSAPEAFKNKVREINRARLAQDYDAAEAIVDELYDSEYAELWSQLDMADFERRSERGDELLPSDLYRNTAGEIEARDTAARRSLTAEERRNLMPKMADENTVFADGGWQRSLDYDPETASIKEQIENSRETLNEMEIVANATVPTNLKSKDSAAAWATERLKNTGYRVDRQGYGEIYFSKKDIDKGLRYSDTTEEKAALAVLPQVLKRGIEIGDHANHKNRAKKTITFAAPVELNGQRGNMAVVVNKNGNHYYTHRIVTPDGKTFVFTKKNAAQELSRGVTVSGSLADTTSAASENSIRSGGENVKQNFSVAADAEQRKAAQFDVIQNSNAAEDDYHTWIRSADEIRTLAETLADPEWAEYDEYDPDYTRQMAEDAIQSGKVTVYSSYPIGSGVFVTPSRMEAESYSANGKVYSKTVNVDDVAWIDPTQGQYAPVRDADIRHSVKGAEVSQEYADVLKENELLKERVDYWKGQTKQTQRATTDEKAVGKEAKSIIKRYGAELDAADIQVPLQRLYDAMANGELDGKEAFSQAKEIAGKLVENAVEADDELYQSYKDLRDFLRTTKLTISEEDGKNIPDLAELRKRNFGRMIIGKGETNVDQVYQELAEQWPEFFDEDAVSHPADQLEQIADVLEQLYTVTEQNPYQGYMEQAKTAAANEVLEDFFDLPQTKKTFADRQAEKLAEAKAHGKEQVSKIREQKNAQLADLREKNKDRVNKLLEKERDRQAKQIGKLKEQYKSRDAAAKERRETRELRNKIIRHTKGLSQKLLRPTDKQHIPEILKHEVAAMLESINMEDNYTLDPATIREGKAGKDGKTTLYGEKLRGADRNEKGVMTRRSEAFEALKAKYTQIVKDGDAMTVDPYLLGNTAEGIRGGFDEVIDMKDTPLADLSKSQLQTMWNVVRAVERSVSTYGKMLSGAKYARTSQWADALKQDTSDRTPFSDRTTRVLLDLETPYTFFSHYGDAGKAIYRILRDAQDQQQLIVNRVTEAAQKIVDPKTVKELEKQTHTFQTEGGKTLTLTTAQAMEVYNLMQREQAMEHLTVGGVFQPEVKSAKIGRGREAIRLTKADLNQIAEVLTPEQIKIADGLQGLTVGMLADYGNEASMKAYGYRKFTEKNYWPIRSANEGVQTTVEKGGNQDRSIKNIGMAKQTTQGANNALEIAGIFDTFANHASDMTDYAAWLCAMEDANHLFNYQFKGADGKAVDSVKAVLEKYGGVGADRYWTKLMRDIQNGINTKEFSPATKVISKTISGFKGAAVGGNIRVVIQQPTAFFRAAAVLSPMDMTNGLVKGVTKGNGWEKALKYSPIAMRKDNGGFDISAPYSMKQTLFDNRDAVRKVNDALSAPAGAADAVTWGRLWNASEWATKRAHPELKPGSNAFYEETARQFAEVIDQTQVVDGVLQRSNIMRARSEIAKQATSFKGEPIMSVNLLMRAADELFHQTDKAKKTAAAKKLGRAAGALLVTDIVNAFVQSLVDGIRDDDKDKKWWERVMSAFSGQSGDEETAWEKGWNFVLDGNLGGNLNKLASMPYISDVFSLIQGYEVARTDTEVIGDIVQAAKTFIKSADGQGQKTWVYATKATIGATAKLFGLPLNNLTRDLWGVLRSVAIETDNIPLQYQLERFIWNIDNQKNASRFGDLLYKALADGDTASYNQIHTDMIVHMGKSGNDLKTMLRSHVKDDYTSRKLTQDEAINFLVKHELADDKDDAFWTVQEWDNAENPEYSKYAELGDAVLNGGTSQTGMTVDELVSFYMEHGAEKKDIQSQITGAVHDAYTDGEINAAAVENLLKQYQAYDADEDGYKTDDEVYWKARKWEAQYYGDEDYSKYDAVYEAVEGDANLKDVIREYTAHGVKEKTIVSQITKHYKPLYLSASASERKAMKAYLVDAYVALGKSRSEASKDIDKWLEE